MTDRLSHFHRLLHTHQKSLAGLSSEQSIQYLLENNSANFHQYKHFNNLNWRDLFNTPTYRSMLPGSLNQNIDFLRHAGLKDDDIPEFFQLYRKRFNEPTDEFIDLYQALLPESKKASFDEIWEIIPPINQSRAETRIPLYHRIVGKYYPQHIDQTLTYLIDTRLAHIESWKKKERDYFVTETGPDGEGVMLALYWSEPKHTADLVKWNLHTNDIHGMGILVIQNRISLTDFLLSSVSMKWDSACRSAHNGYEKISIKDDVVSILPQLLSIKNKNEISSEIDKLKANHPNLCEALLHAKNPTDAQGSNFEDWIQWIQLLTDHGIIPRDHPYLTKELHRNLEFMRAKIGSMDTRDTSYCHYKKTNTGYNTIDLLQKEEPWKEVGFWHLVASATWNKPDEYINTLDKSSLENLKYIDVKKLISPKFQEIKSIGHRSQYAAQIFKTCVYLLPYLKPEDQAYIGAYAAIFVRDNPKTLRSYWKEHNTFFGNKIPASVSNEDYLLYSLARKEPKEVKLLSELGTLSNYDKFEITYKWLLKELAPTSMTNELHILDCTSELTL